MRWSGCFLYPGPLLALMEFSFPYRGSRGSRVQRGPYARRCFQSPSVIHRDGSVGFVFGSGLDQDLESAPEPALAVERHRLRVHHLRQALVLHDLGVDAVAMRARLVHDIGEYHRLAGFQLDALRERRVLARLHVVGQALDVFQRAVVAPDLARRPRHAPVGRQFSLRDRYHESIYVSHVSPPAGCLTGLVLGNNLQVGKTGLEVLADHAVHVDEYGNELRNIEHGALHEPGDVCGVALGFEREFDDVVRFERLHEVQLDRDLGWRHRLRDLHAPLADGPVAFPGVYGALAAGDGAEGPFHRGVFLLPGRPGFPAQEIVEHGKDLLWRRLDARRALDPERVGLGRGIEIGRAHV